MAAAYYLRLQGVAVTVFDAQDDFGGMTRYGIPEYRLPKAILSKEVAHFAQMGIELVPGKKLGENLDLAELKAAYDAVVIAIGCWKASGLRCEGEELATPGIEFLHSVAVNNNTGKNPGRTLVIGGGNTAMDCVRTSVRLGSSDVTCIYRRTEAEMPAEKIEIAEAKEEGVKFQFLTAPVKLEKRGTKLILTCLKMELGEHDASGRRKPVAVPGSEFEIEADTVISAIGQEPMRLPEFRSTVTAIWRSKRKIRPGSKIRSTPQVTALTEPERWSKHWLPDGWRRWRSLKISSIRQCPRRTASLSPAAAGRR